MSAPAISTPQNARRYRERDGGLSVEVAEYWNDHVHDLEIATQPVGSSAFFEELDAYRYEKLDYLPRVIAAAAVRGRRVLEVGCGLGTDLIRFASAGAYVTGVDISSSAIVLAKQNLAHNRIPAALSVMNGERLAFDSAEFDVVYAYSVLHYTPNAFAMVSEIHRVLRPGGMAILMVYNKVSWLNVVSHLTNVAIEHTAAPVQRKFTPRQFRRLMKLFDSVQISTERLPVKTRLHAGLKAELYNELVVPAFGQLPRSVTRSLGWHLIGTGYKQADG